MIFIYGLVDLVGRAMLWPESGVVLAVLALLAWINVLIGLGFLIHSFQAKSLRYVLLGIAMAVTGGFTGLLCTFIVMVNYACFVDGMCL
jgi:hypothetical protein